MEKLSDWLPPVKKWNELTGRDGRMYADGWNACRESVIEAAPAAAVERNRARWPAWPDGELHQPLPTDTPSDLVKSARLAQAEGRYSDRYNTMDAHTLCGMLADRIEDFERESVIWRKRAEKAERELAEVREQLRGYRHAAATRQRRIMEQGETE